MYTDTDSLHRWSHSEASLVHSLTLVQVHTHTLTEMHRHLRAYIFLCIPLNGPGGQGLLCKVKQTLVLCLPAALLKARGATHLHTMNTNDHNGMLRAIRTQADGV